MDRISVQVGVENASDATLQLHSSDLDHGDWTNSHGAPPTIGPGQTAGWEGEGHLAAGVPSTGTEGRVIYSINAPSTVGELYIHWDSPLIESQYGNTYHVWCPPGWEVGYTGGQGHNAVIDIRLRRSALRRVPNFDPQVRGFAFPNTWDASLPSVKLGLIVRALFGALAGFASDVAGKIRGSIIPGPTPNVPSLPLESIPDDWGPTLTSASHGLCGGMTFTTMDYYYAHQIPPADPTAPTSEANPLFGYIRERQMQSFDINGRGSRFVVYPLSLYPNGDEGFVQDIGMWKGRSWVAYREAWPQIQADIDAGQLSPMGLIRSDNNDLAHNHQVLAYGYQRSGQDVTLYIAEPNFPKTVVTYQFNITDTSGEVHLTIMANGKEVTDHRIYCFFRLDGYTPATPPFGRHIGSLRDAALTVSETREVVSLRALAPRQESMLGWLRTL